MSRRRPYALIPIDNDGTYPPYNRRVAVVRYDGDPDVFTALVHAWLMSQEFDETVLPPEPRLYRWNPDPSRTYTSVLADAARPGPGVWLGAVVELARRADGPIADKMCNPCDAVRGERHYSWCPVGRRKAKGLIAA